MEGWTKFRRIGFLFWFFWFFRVTVEEKPNGLRLRIRNVTDDDRGIWKCLATDVQNQRFSNQFELRVKSSLTKKKRFSLWKRKAKSFLRFEDPIKFLGDSIQYITLNNPALIHCRVTESHSTEISWFKGQEKIPIFADRFFSSRYEQNADGLRIERVSSIDEDLFTCQADQIETGETKEFQIQTVLARLLIFSFSTLTNNTKDILPFRRNSFGSNRLSFAMWGRKSGNNIDLSSRWNAQSKLFVVLRTESSIETIVKICYSRKSFNY